jgi:tyrosine-protein kinase Etk/Wzc
MIVKDKSSENSTEMDQEIDIKKFVGILIDHFWLIISITTIVVIVGLMYCLVATPIYRADALVQVEQDAGNSLMTDLATILPVAQPLSSAEIELIESRMVIGKTVQDLDLQTVVSEKFFPVFGEVYARMVGMKKNEIAVSRVEVPNYLNDEKLEINILNDNKYNVTYKGSKILEGEVGKIAEGNNITLLVSDVRAEPGTTFVLIKKSELTGINNILGNLTVEEKSKDSGVLSLILIGPDPNLIQNTLNSIANNYQQQNVQRKSAEAAKSLEFLNSTLPTVRQSLDEAEDKLNKYRQRKDSVDLSLEAKSVLDTMVTTESQLNELTFKEAEISKLYTKEHPAYRSLLEQRQTLEDQKASLDKKISAMPETQQEILRLTRDAQANQATYMQLLNKQQELSISKASTIGNVRIVDPAVVQPKPIEPRNILVLLSTVIFGLFIAILYVLIKNIFRQGIENPEQLEQKGLSVYASIPLSLWQVKQDKEFLKKSRKNKNRSNTLISIHNPTDLAVEAIRSLRTSLHFAMMEAKNNILMTTGVSSSIGKSFVTLNLAAVLAQSGKKILVIDGDLRKGYAHTILGLELKNGLSDILSGKSNMIDSVQISTDLNNLHLISRGAIPPNPSELLMHERLDELLKWASENYDIVLIDTPPILAVTDGAIIGQSVGTVLMVARFEFNTLKEIEIGVRRFEQNGIIIKGIILNAVVRKAINYYTYGYHYDTYKYK